MRASDLRHPIEFQTTTTSSDGMGGLVEGAWATVKSTRAKIVPIGASIDYQDGQSRGFKNFELTTRYTKDFEITRRMRIKWGDRYLVPNVPVNIDSLEIWMTFEASEKV